MGKTKLMAIKGKKITFSFGKKAKKKIQKALDKGHTVQLDEYSLSDETEIKFLISKTGDGQVEAFCFEGDSLDEIEQEMKRVICTGEVFL